jgi:quinolinate synthase
MELVEKVNELGFVNIEIDPTLDLFLEIEKLKKLKNAIILAHYYQNPDIQDVADYIGDSLGLAKAAEETDADIIVFAGVHFMAETAKILNPTKKVLLPDLNAGCSLADSCPADEFSAFKSKHPNHKVVSYINCSADIKALTDIICTSTNALDIINSIPKEQGIIFAPDRNLGRWLVEKTGRDMILWDGSCQVHEIFSLEKIVKLIVQHPEAEFIAHPECEQEILVKASFVGSTTALLNYSKSSDCNTFIVGTETGIIHQMEKDSPKKTFIPAPPDNSCACNDCPHMKLNTMEKLYLTMKYELPELNMSEDLIQKALIPMKRMMDVSRKAGLIK